MLCNFLLKVQETLDKAMDGISPFATPPSLFGLYVRRIILQIKHTSTIAHNMIVSAKKVITNLSGCSRKQMDDRQNSCEKEVNKARNTSNEK